MVVSRVWGVGETESCWAKGTKFQLYGINVFWRPYVQSGNYHSGEYLKFPKRTNLKLKLLNTEKHTQEGNYVQVMDNLFRLIMVILSQCIHIHKNIKLYTLNVCNFSLSNISQ